MGHKGFLKAPSIRAKLLLCFLAIALVVWGLLSSWALSTTRSFVEGKAISAFQSAVDEGIHSADNNAAKVETLADLVGNLGDVEQYLAGSNLSPYDEYRIARDMLSHLETLLRGMGIPAALPIVSNNADIQEIIPVDVEGLLSTSGSQNHKDALGQVSIALYRAKRFQQDAMTVIQSNWYVDARNGATGWRQTSQDAQRGSVSFIKALPASPFSSSRGVLRISVRLEDIVVSEQELYLFDGQGELIFMTPEQAPPELPEGISLNGGDTAAVADGKAVLSGRMENGWQQVWIIPYDAMESFSAVLYQFFLMLLLSLALALVLSVCFSGWFTRRILAVRDSLYRFQQGDYGCRIQVKSSDEIGMLADGYNSMADHINRLIHDVFQTEIRSQQEHLTMLQSQIRPHFLYNSLSSIVRLCDRGDVGLIREMAQALVRFYRISLSKGRETITLQEEIDHVSAYVQVCAIRYRGKFQMRYEISPEAKSCFVPKIILQPFVENALEHGMHPTLGILHIEISARVEEGMLLVEIQDDGVGMDEDRLREMEKEASSSGEGYGISNVRERIRITYGEGCGVSLLPKEPHGLIVRLTMEAQDTSGAKPPTS